jgi:hypothetical protein
MVDPRWLIKGGLCFDWRILPTNSNLPANSTQKLNQNLRCIFKIHTTCHLSQAIATGILIDTNIVGGFQMNLVSITITPAIWRASQAQTVARHCGEREYNGRSSVVFPYSAVSQAIVSTIDALHIARVIDIETRVIGFLLPSIMRELHHSMNYNMSSAASASRLAISADPNSIPLFITHFKELFPEDD